MFFYKSLNCWFCNQNTKVTIFKQNSWTCSHCDQYNGFKKDGDYNKDIVEMHNEKQPPIIISNTSKTKHERTNCLCERCNFYQQLKIEKLSNFEPKNEKTFDLEITLYKEYLEKIYTLCHNCQSKVKFEITKQDGILKQYLLNLGMFSYFYQKTPRSDTKSIPQIKRKKTVQSNLDYLYNSLRSFLLLLILIMSTLTLVYNEKVSKYQITSSNIVNELETSNYWTRTIEFLDEDPLIKFSRESIYNFHNQFAINSLNKQDFTIYMNKNITLFMVLIYFFSCVLIITWPKATTKAERLNLWFICFIAAVDLMFILMNFTQFKNLFKPTLATTSPVCLNQVFVFVPLMQLPVLYQICNSCLAAIWELKRKFNRNQNTKKTIKNSNKESNQQQKNIDSPFKASENLENIWKNSQVKFNYSFLTPSTYSLTKFLNPSESQSNETKSTLFDINKNSTIHHQPALTTGLFTHNLKYPLSKCDSSVITNGKSIIKPARLFDRNGLARCRNQQGWRNSQESLENLSNRSFTSEESEEGSIVSGLTNLYLGRSERRNQSKLFLNPSSSHESYQSPMNDEDSFNEYSFYQGTHRSYRSNPDDEIDFSGSQNADRPKFYQNNMRSNLQILKLFE